MPNIMHGSIVNKTDFYSWKFLKIAGTADIEFDGARFSKNIFSGQKYWKYAEKTIILPIS